MGDDSGRRRRGAPMAGGTAALGLLALGVIAIGSLYVLQVQAQERLGDLRSELASIPAFPQASEGRRFEGTDPGQAFLGVSYTAQASQSDVFSHYDRAFRARGWLPAEPVSLRSVELHCYRKSPLWGWLQLPNEQQPKSALVFSVGADWGGSSCSARN